MTAHLHQSEVEAAKVARVLWRFHVGESVPMRDRGAIFYSAAAGWIRPFVRVRRGRLYGHLTERGLKEARAQRWIALGQALASESARKPQSQRGRLCKTQARYCALRAQDARREAAEGR